MVGRWLIDFDSSATLRRLARVQLRHVQLDQHPSRDRLLEIQDDEFANFQDPGAERPSKNGQLEQELLVVGGSEAPPGAPPAQEHL